MDQQHLKQDQEVINPNEVIPMLPVADLLFRKEDTSRKLVGHPPAGTKIYLSGPMKGLKNNNYPHFHAIEQFLKLQIATAEALSHTSPAFKDIFSEIWGQSTVISPARHNLPQDAEYKDYMRSSLSKLLHCASAILLLPGWQYSDGCATELSVAKSLSLDIYALDLLHPLASTTAVDKSKWQSQGSVTLMQFITIHI